ncbi:helix-turn-helix domain-containing protein [Novosphingobium sp.]|uniref:helix-turn-helix domain-containing protein n=1 Tax=Novosphingobium sp. TaxID=1874826 RepID=UPI0025E77432|nr:helix-turn-helix domain-containing protein [Novosphingobium sp.]MCC6926105.1 sigma-54-dependent Fis family transcriptional regulator [Novosphingobium sp.]
MAGSRENHSDRVLATVQSGNAAATSSVAASWCRSALHHGLDPAAPARGTRIGGSTLDQLREANGELLAAATPVLDTLYGSVGRTGCAVVLSDTDGVILESRSQQGDHALFDAIGLVSGAEWSEAAEGTNGIGTCLVEARPVTILRQEHFASRNVGVSCMDAPVFDPEGQLVAALDVSTCRADHGEALAALIAALVQDAARQIERDFFCRRYADARIVYAPEGPARGSALLAVDRDDLVIGATRAARRQFHLGNGQLSSPRPLADVLGTGEQAGFEDSERAILRQALARSGGNVTAAARLLGIGRATMYRRMERAGMGGMH